jgi:anti-sigma factor RsiW
VRRPPTASCEDVVRLLTDYHEDALPVPERLDFERHVAVCPACRGYLSQMRAVLGAARARGGHGLPPADEAALLAAFRALRPGER